MKKINFNDGWVFHKTTSSSVENGFGGIKNTTENVIIPHDALIHTSRNPKAAGGGAEGYFESFDCEYTKNFRLPSNADNHSCYIEFDCIYRNARIWINDDYAGEHHYGYGNFLIDIGKLLKAGEDNSLRIVVNNGSPAHSRWYSGQGLLRDITLYTGNSLHIQPYGVKITTVEADETTARLRLETEIYQSEDHPVSATLKHLIKDSNGSIVHQTAHSISISKPGISKFEEYIYISSPLLWSPDTPTLYTCETLIEIGEKTVDSLEDNFGIRTLKLDPYHGLRINGKNIKLKGGCIHHDNGILGDVSIAEIEFRRVKKLKEAGYNALRSSHNPMSNAMLKACDSLGMLVMDEFSDVWIQPKVTNDYSAYFNNDWESEVTNMIRKDYNHPCVIFYSIGNEIPEIGTPFGACLGRKIAQKYRELDATRYITNSVNFMMAVIQRIGSIMQSIGIGLAQDGFAPNQINDLMSDTTELMPRIATHPEVKQAIEESLSYLDVIGINYASAVAEDYHQDHPDWIFMGSETFPKDLSANWSLVENHPYLLGDFSWTAWDYLGESGIGRITEEKPDIMLASMGNYPWLTASTGDFDILGFRRPVSYWREFFFHSEKQKPFICVTNPEEYGKDLYRSQWSFTNGIHSWTWNNHENKETQVEVYTNGEEAELFINGISQGKKDKSACSKENCYVWNCNYVPGTIEAVAYNEHKEIGRDILKTANDSSTKICIFKETFEEFCTDSNYALLNIELRDCDNTLNMNLDHILHISVEGGTLLAFGSANPCTEELFSKTSCQTYQGRAQAVIYRDSSAPVKVIISSEYLTDSVIHL